MYHKQHNNIVLKHLVKTKLFALR